jgi:hypothetical protein
MNQPRPFWKQPRGMFLLGLGGFVLLATGWLALSRLGGGSAGADVFDPRPRVDENALIAANAERPDQAATAPGPSANVVEASAGGKPPAGEADAGGDKERTAADDIIADVDQALDSVEQEVGELVDELEGDKENGGKE